MDSIDKFDKILNLVERARRLDFVAIDVMDRLNKSNLDFYNVYNKINKEQAKEEETGITRKKETDMDENAVKQAFEQFMLQFKKQTSTSMQETPPMPPDEDPPAPAPTPAPAPLPEPEPEPQPSKDTVKLTKIKGAVGIISDRVKTQADMLKHVHTIMIETHRMSFALWKEIDDYLIQRPKS